MNHSNNRSLIELSKVWLVDGDWMRCRGCGAVLIASRDGEPLRHKADDCRHVAHVHPWRDLRNAMADNISPGRHESATADSRGAASPQSSESTGSPTTGEGRG